jgi:hypothetical protein
MNLSTSLSNIWVFHIDFNLIIGFEQENMKYQELVEKFEEQSRLKEDEFLRVKD